MNYYSLICLIFFFVCFFSIGLSIREAKRKSSTISTSNNMKSREIVSLLRIKNDYEKILTVFNDLDDRCKKNSIDASPDFRGYFE